MPHNHGPQTTESRLPEAVVRFNAGDETAVEDLLGHVRHRLMVITRRTLRGPRGFATVARWYGTDDVVQDSRSTPAITSSGSPPSRSGGHC